MNEIWKDIQGYEGSYQVSNTGFVRSVPREIVQISGNSYNVGGAIKKPTANEKGYLSVKLYKGNKKRGMLVHRLVAIHFLDNPYNLPEVNHKNAIKSCCHVDNLEWTTQLENKAHAKNLKLCKQGKDHYKAKVILDTQTGIFYDVVKEAAFAKNLSRDQMKRRLRGKTVNNTSVIYV